jgi:hypothetical protein
MPAPRTTGRRALVELQPLDCWAHHAVAHVMEMQGRAEDGIGWMIAREPYWSGDDNFFKVHNWWHRALCSTSSSDEHDEALALYDGPIREDRSAVALDLVDASALLWRLHLLGHDVGSRWQELADAWDATCRRPHLLRSTTGTRSWPISAPAATGRRGADPRAYREGRRHGGSGALGAALKSFGRRQAYESPRGRNPRAQSMAMGISNCG